MTGKMRFTEALHPLGFCQGLAPGGDIWSASLLVRGSLVCGLSKKQAALAPECNIYVGEYSFSLVHLKETIRVIHKALGTVITHQLNSEEQQACLRTTFQISNIYDYLGGTDSIKEDLLAWIPNGSRGACVTDP